MAKKKYVTMTKFIQSIVVFWDVILYGAYDCSVTNCAVLS